MDSLVFNACLDTKGQGLDYYVSMTLFLPAMTKPLKKDVKETLTY